MKKNLIYILLAMLTSVSISVDVAAIYQGGASGLELFQFSFLFMALFTIVFYILYRKTSVIKLHLLQHMLAALFGLFMIIGNSFEQVGSSALFTANLAMVALSLLQWFSYYLLFSSFLRIINGYLEKKAPKKEKQSSFWTKLNAIFSQHPLLISFLFLMACWSIYMLAFYPLILSNDPSFQIKQYFNVPTKYIDYIIPLDPNVNLTAHHPVLHTILLGGSIELGRFFGSDNLGLFIYAVFQSALLALAFATSIVYLYKKNKSIKTCVLLLLIYGLVPVFPFYALSAVKDTIYTALIIFYVIFLLHLIETKDHVSWKKAALLFLIMVSITLFRNNGIYVIVLSFPFLLWQYRRQVLSLLLVFIATVGSYMMYQNVILPSFHIAAGSKREALSVPFQQTARYVREHGDEVTTEERIAIDKILGYSDLAERYNPTLADPVKNEFNKYATNDDLKAYFQVWFQQFLKHPTTYVEATIHNTYGYIYPNTTKWYIYYKYSDLITEDNLVDYHYNGLSGLRSVLSGYGVAFPYIPLLGLIVNIGFNGWILLFSVVYFIVYRKRKYLICFSPLYISFLICFISPANTYFRYAMPYVFCMPFLVSYLHVLLKGKISQKDLELKNSVDNDIINT